MFVHVRSATCPASVGRSSASGRGRYIALALVLLLAVPAVPAVAKGETIDLLYPNGGEVLLGGQYVDVEWQPSTSEGYVALYYSTDGGATYPNHIRTVANEPKVGYSWRVPWNVNSTMVRLRIDWVASDEPGATVLASDESDGNFTIEESVVLSFSRLPEVARAGTNHLVTWDLYDALGKVKALELNFRVRTPGGAWGDWSSVAPGFDTFPTTRGGMWWRPPSYEEAEGQFRLRAISSISHRTYIAENVSEAFDIETPPITLVRPNGGEVLVGGTTYDVEWRTPEYMASTITAVGVDYSVDGGPWVPITETEDDGVYTWSVPGGLDSDRLRVRVSAESIEFVPFAWDWSDGDNTVVPDASTHAVGLVAPNPHVEGAVIVDGGGLYNVEWAVTGPVSGISEFRIHLSTDSGGSYTHIMTAGPDETLRTWTVPRIDTTDARIMVELVRTDSTNRTAASSNDFYIGTNESWNRPPVARVAESLIEVTEGDDFTLDGSPSFDPDGDAVYHRWTQVDTTGFEVDRMPSVMAVTTLSADVADWEVHLMFMLEVEDRRRVDVDTALNTTVVTVHVLPLPPVIDSFYPANAIAGSEVRVTGEQLMGAEVLIGGVVTGTVPTSPTPDEPNPDDTWAFTVTEDVPVGPSLITVRNRVGSDTSADEVDVHPVPQYCYDWGFSFRNKARSWLDYPIFPWETGSYEDTFGTSTVFLCIWFCLGIPYWTPSDGWECWGESWDIPTVPDPLALAFYFPAYCHLASSGRCFGISANSLALYHGDITTDELQEDTWIVSSLELAGALARRVNYMHGSQVSSECIHEILSQATEQMLPSSDDPPTGLGRVLDDVRKACASNSLGIISVTSGTQGHAMVPYRVVDVDGNTTRIYVYDSNRNWTCDPDQVLDHLSGHPPSESHPPYIEVNRTGTHWRWSYDISGSTHWEEVSGLYFFPWRVVSGDRSLPLTPEGAFHLVFGDATATVTDGEGNSLEAGPEGVVTSEIEGAAVIPAYGADGPIPTVYYTPAGDHTVRFAGTGEGVYNWTTIVGDRAAYGLGGVASTDGSRDTVEMTYGEGNPYMGTMALSTVGGAKGYSATMVKRFGNVTRVYRVINSTIASDSWVEITTSEDYNGTVYTNLGPRTVTFDVEFQTNAMSKDVFNATGLPEGLPTARLEGVTVGPYESVLARPSDWLDLDNTEVVWEVVGLAPGVPSEPLALELEAFKDQVTLTWSPPENTGSGPVTGYVISRGPSPDDLTVIDSIGNVTVYVDTDVMANTTYHYGVAAVNGDGEGKAATYTVETLPETPPGEDEMPTAVIWISLVLVILVTMVIVVVTFMVRSKGSRPGGGS